LGADEKHETTNKKNHRTTRVDQGRSLPQAIRMIRSYVLWALVGMAGYSFMTITMKLAIREGRFSSFLVLALATTVVCSISWVIALARGDLRSISAADLTGTSGMLTLATGVLLTVAVSSLFYALSLGPASVVVPLYGMFVAGGAVLGILFLHESASAQKLIGVALATFSIYLIATSPPR
jgi:transporter family protein